MNIVLLNQSKRVSDVDAALMANACEEQLRLHVCPAWERIAPTVLLAVDPKTISPGSAVVVLLDAADVDGALGYHEEVGDQVVGKVFAGPVLDNGGSVLGNRQNLDAYSVSATLSHELIELVLDPDANLWAEGPGGLFALEGCDPVEAASYIVATSGHEIAVSDFVLPGWFDPQADRPCDFLGKLTSPFTLAPGGYAIVRGASDPTQVFGETPPPDWRIASKALGRSAGRLS